MRTLETGALIIEFLSEAKRKAAEAIGRRNIEMPEAQKAVS
jgi:hypothetical protein